MIQHNIRVAFMTIFWRYFKIYKPYLWSHLQEHGKGDVKNKSLSVTVLVTCKSVSKV